MSNNPIFAKNVKLSDKVYKKMIIQMNDTAKEKSFLRKKGLEDGVEKVVNDLLEAQISAYGVRGSNMGVVRSGGFVDR